MTPLKTTSLFTCRATLAVLIVLAGRAQPALPVEGPLTRLQPDAPQTQPSDDRVWYDGRHLLIEGKAWQDTEAFYDRLPARAKEKVTPSVWSLSHSSAGMCLRFVTDASHISVHWTLTSSNLAMPHMPATGVSGLDLYVRHQDKWHWIGVGRPLGTQTHEWNRAATRVGTGAHEYLLYLPLYNGIKSLQIGIAKSSTLSRPEPRTVRPVCVYGTSIVQGGCASRPGMAHVAILGRRLDRPTINLGFSGSGKMEPEMASLLAELDVAAYVLDCLPNMTTEMVRSRLEPFVVSLRNARPGVPIVLVESVIPQATSFLPPAEQSITEKNTALREIFDRLKAGGMKHLDYILGIPLLGDDGEGTVDGVHPTDVGFMRMAEAMDPIVRKVIAGR